MEAGSGPARPAGPRSMFARVGAVLFLATGRLDWLDAWVFLVIYFLIAAAAQAWMTHRDPYLAEERWQWGANTKAWDKWIVSTNAVLLFLLLAVIGLDAGRFGWSVVPWPVRVGALLGLAPAFALPLLASRANPFLASTVRLQEERKHHVAAGVPYAYLRHPMYAGMVLYDVRVPLVLGSWAGLAVGGVMIILVIVRTALEHQALQAELPGYREYAARVRYRLLPGLWSAPFPSALALCG